MQVKLFGIQSTVHKKFYCAFGNCTWSISHRNYSIKAMIVLNYADINCLTATHSMSFFIFLPWNLHYVQNAVAHFQIFTFLTEYMQSGRATEKTDVYSFGVLVLEVVSGKRPTDASFIEKGLNIVGWVRLCFSDILLYLHWKKN